jgi:hypothetical protein
MIPDSLVGMANSTTPVAVLASERDKDWALDTSSAWG